MTAFGCTQPVRYACGAITSCPDGSHCGDDGFCRYDTPGQDSGARDAAPPPHDAGASADAPGSDAHEDDAFVCPDRDGDGHADAMCGGTDCDDNDATVSPDATDVCNDVDDDCVGGIDDTAVCNAFDHTSDTACRAGACTFTMCSTGALDCDLVATNGCESSGPSCTYPAPRLVGPLSGMVVTSNRPELRFAPMVGATGGRVQICDDAACATVRRTLDGATMVTVDADLPPGRYYWRAYGTVGTSVGATPSATWTFYTYATATPPHATTAFTLFDVNGGIADAVFGAPTMPSGEIRLDIDATAAVTQIPGAAAGYGSSISTVDVDADGRPDVVVGACAGHVDPTAVVSSAQACGRAAYVMSGAAGAIGSILRMHGGYTGDSTHDGYGYSVAGIGDFDGDGYGDYAVGMYGENGVIVYFGGPGARLTTLQPTGVAANAAVGIAVASAGDLDGDHRDDLLVGSAEGVLRIYHYDAADPVSITTPCRSVSGLGDTNGDGLSDFAASSGPGTTRSVAVHLGAIDRTYVQAWTTTGTGTAVVGAGDFDRNGLADVAVSTGEPERMLQYYRGFDGMGAVALIGARQPSPAEPGFGRWLGRAGTPASPIVLEASYDAAVMAPLVGMALTRATRWDAMMARILFTISWTGGTASYGGAVIH